MGWNSELNLSKRYQGKKVAVLTRDGSDVIAVLFLAESSHNLGSTISRCSGNEIESCDN